MKQYLDLVQDVLDNGVVSEDRTGTGTLSVFGRQLRFDLSKGFPMMTTKRVPFKSVLAELLWFLKGDDNIDFLLENGCTIWNEWAETEDSTYEKLSTGETVVKKRKGDLGPLYPIQWRKWEDTRTIDREDHEGMLDLVGRGYELVGSLESPSHLLTVTKEIDQIANVIESIKTDPYSRRHIVSTWNVGKLDDMNLNPCHYAFQFYVRDGKLSLLWMQR